MRRSRLAWLATLSFLALAVPLAPAARAEGDGEEIYYDWSHMKLAADALPEGWKLVQGATELGSDQRTAIHDAVAEAAKEATSDAQAAVAYLQSVDLGDGKVATIALVDVKAKPTAVLAAIKVRAEKAGWAFREMGSPSRLMVAAAPDDLKERVVAVQSKWAGRQLALLAVHELDQSYPHRALPIAKAAVSIEPGAAPAHLVLGLLAKEGVKPDGPPELWDPVIAELRAATNEKAIVPLSEREGVEARGELGLALLERKNANEEARDVLTKAVAGARLIDPQNALINRYNLACAHGRLKELDPAFEHLKATLEANEKIHFQGLVWRTDADFENLHADPRWAELLTKYPETAHAGGH